MLRRIDRSQALSRLIERASSLLAKRRGLPVLIGILLVLTGFAIQAINVYVDNQTLELLGVIAGNLGVLIALISLLLAEPLGK